MYKKVLSAFLALVMTLGVLTIPALAANDYLQLNKTNYEPNETITVTVTGITQKMQDDEAFVAIYKKGAGHNDWGKYYYPKAGSDVLTFMAPAESGDYEMRLYRADHQNDYGAVFVTSVPFTVGKVAKQGSITIDAAKYTAGNEITVTVTGITAQMATAEAFVATYKKGAAHDKWVNYRFLPEGSSVQKINAPFDNGEYEMRLYSTNKLYTDDTFIMAVPFTVSGASSWATDTLQKADDMGLIPDSLRGADLTGPITRKEFAAVAVKTYENLTGKTTTPVAKNPFTDTNDTEVLKAYNVGLTSGTAADKFSPDVLLNREQAATMLTRVLKAAYITGWTLPTDGNYTLNFTQPAKFADDEKISDWAKPSVYFMAANGIIAGTGNNMFSPRAITTAEQAANYASATREQALVIAVRMVENLKGKPLDYTEGASQGTTTQEPAQPSGGSNAIAGKWTNEYNRTWRDPENKPTGYETRLRGFEFSNDGSFYSYMITAGFNLGTNNGAAIYRGKYSVTGDAITFTNVEEKWIAYDSVTTSYDWKSSSSVYFTTSAKYKFDDEGLLWLDLANGLTTGWYYPVK